MYEHFKKDFLVILCEHSGISESEYAVICKALDKAACNYDIAKKETALALYSIANQHLSKSFLVCKAVEGYSKNTLINYGLYINRFFEMCPKNYDTITSNDIRLFLYQYQEQRHLSNNSLEKLRCCLATFFKWAAEEGYIETNPCLQVKAIKCERKERQPLTQVDLEYLRSACITPRDRAIIEVLYSTGCRISELTTLKKSDIDWLDKTVHLFGKGKKHRKSFLNAKAEVALKEYLQTRKGESEYLFVINKKPYTQMHVDSVRDVLHNIEKRVGDKLQHKVTPHVIRHTTATRMLENNASISSIQMLLGHENISTTMIYAHNSLEKVQQEHARAII